jgi:hypothetical protein
VIEDELVRQQLDVTVEATSPAVNDSCRHHLEAIVPVFWRVDTPGPRRGTA